jgi:glycosyltransferase involved in cell wall biosynthesis
MFSILIPSWNNLPYLKLCLDSIEQYSSLNNQIIVHVNEGIDGTLDYVKNRKITFSYSSKNTGVCYALNRAAELATHDYILFVNDDMFVLPGWDKIIASEIENLNTDCFMISATMIEPYDTHNNCVIVNDFGQTPETFERQKLLDEFRSFSKADWSGSTWPPVVVHRKWWEYVKGYSEEFSPGMASDDDFAMKMWTAGCRFYKGLATSRVYHFISKSTGRVTKNNGKRQFLKKWGIKQSTFHRYYTHRGEAFSGILPNPPNSLGLLFDKAVAGIKRLNAG